MSRLSPIAACGFRTKGRSSSGFFTRIVPSFAKPQRRNPGRSKSRAFSPFTSTHPATIATVFGHDADEQFRRFDDSGRLGENTAVKDGLAVFNPAGTSYELYLAVPNYTGPLNSPVKCLIRVTARKVYTVPSGGNFIAPISARRA